MKILILNDTHDKGKNPINRLDDYHKSLMEQLDETIEISKQCDLVIHLGDVWDSPFVSNTIIDDWLDRIESAKKLWYILPGNHDMVGGRWETSNASALAHTFRRSKYVSKLDFLDYTDTNEALYIEGYPYITGIEDTLKEQGLFHNQKDCFTVACTHAFISVKEFPFASHIKMSDLKTNYDLILCSHFHTVFDETINHTRFFNLGAWGRTSVTEANQKPSVAILDTATKQIEIIPLKSAKLGNQVFALDNLEALKNKEANLDMFIQSLESTTFQGQSIQNIINNVAKEKQIDKEVVNLILQKIEELK